MKKYSYILILAMIISGTQLYMSWSIKPWTWLEITMAVYPLGIAVGVILFSWVWRKNHAPRNRFHVV